MQIALTRKFHKQVENCKDLQTRSKVLIIIEDVSASESMIGFNNLKKTNRI